MQYRDEIDDADEPRTPEEKAQQKAWVEQFRALTFKLSHLTGSAAHGWEINLSEPEWTLLLAALSEHVDAIDLAPETAYEMRNNVIADGEQLRQLLTDYIANI